MKHKRNRLIIEIIGTVIALVLAAGVIAEVNDDDDDCDTCQVEYDD